MTFARLALRGKIGPDEAEPEGCGGPTVEGENEVWPDLPRNPQGWGPFSPFLRRSQTPGMRLSLLELRKIGPSAGRGKVNSSL